MCACDKRSEWRSKAEKRHTPPCQLAKLRPRACPQHTDLLLRHVMGHVLLCLLPPVSRGQTTHHPRRSQWSPVGTGWHSLQGPILPTSPGKSLLPSLGLDWWPSTLWCCSGAHSSTDLRSQWGNSIGQSRVTPAPALHF